MNQHKNELFVVGEGYLIKRGEEIFRVTLLEITNKAFCFIFTILKNLSKSGF